MEMLIYTFGTDLKNGQRSGSVVVFDSRSIGWELEPHRMQCVVSLSKTLYHLLITSSTQEDLSRHDREKMLTGIKNNKKDRERLWLPWKQKLPYTFIGKMLPQAKHHYF